jgi:hypothetical protein
MQPAQGLAELLDLGFGDVFFVLGFGELLGDFVEIAKDAFEGFADALHFLFRLKNPGPLFRGQIAVAGTAFLSFARGTAVGRSTVRRSGGTVGFPTRLVATAIARRQTAITRGNAAASSSATATSMTPGAAWAAWATWTGTAWSTGAGALIMGGAFGARTLVWSVIGAFVGRRSFVGFVRPFEIGSRFAMFARIRC